MAYSGNLTSIESVIERVHRDSGYETIDIGDVLEWTADLMKLLGIPASLVDKSTNGQDDNYDYIPVENYKALLPADLVYLIAIRKVVLNNNKDIIGVYPMIENQDMFFSTSSTNQIFGAIVTEPFFKTVQINSEGEPEVVQITQENRRLTGNQTYQYKISGDVVFTNFENGALEIAYKGFPIDDNGFPMVPDDIKFIKALEWEIISNMDNTQWRLNPASPGLRARLNDSEQKRDWYVGAAKTKGVIPNISQMESLKNSWLRSIQKVDSFTNGFRTNNYPEVRYTLNARRWKTR
jgi:hypothetical protein